MYVFDVPVLTACWLLFAGRNCFNVPDRQWKIRLRSGFEDY